MSKLIIVSLVVVLVLLVVLITLYYFGFFNSRASDLPPFSDISYAIEPSVKKMAKKDYNRIIATVFSVLNNQLLNDGKADLMSPGSPVIAAIQEELEPLLEKISKKYTPELRAKIVKYFVCKHLVVLLDNFYLGPHIYVTVPDIPWLNIRAFPFVYDAKRVPGVKPARASKLAPFKYFAKNIPVSIRAKVASLYDDILRRYMRAFNRAVSNLPELNWQTLQSINMNSIMQRYSIMMKKDMDTIQLLFGANIARVIKQIFIVNVLPILNMYYKGPAINLSIPATIPTNPHIISINFPNTNQADIIKVQPGCPDNQVLQTTIIDKEKGLKSYECISNLKNVNQLSFGKSSPFPSMNMGSGMGSVMGSGMMSTPSSPVYVPPPPMRYRSASPMTQLNRNMPTALVSTPTRSVSSSPSQSCPFGFERTGSVGNNIICSKRIFGGKPCPPGLIMSGGGAINQTPSGSYNECRLPFPGERVATPVRSTSVSSASSVSSVSSMSSTSSGSSSSSSMFSPKSK